MIAISFKTHGTNCRYKFFIKFQYNHNNIFRVNKNYIIVEATISSLKKRDVIQYYGFIVKEKKTGDKSYMFRAK